MLKATARFDTTARSFNVERTPKARLESVVMQHREGIRVGGVGWWESALPQRSLIAQPKTNHRLNLGSGGTLQKRYSHPTHTRTKPDPNPTQTRLKTRLEPEVYSPRPVRGSSSSRSLGSLSSSTAILSLLSSPPLSPRSTADPILVSSTSSSPNRLVTCGGSTMVLSNWGAFNDGFIKLGCF